MRKHLFFIDDDCDFLYVIKRTCRKIEGVSKVSTASHGKDALEKINGWVQSGQDLPNIAFIDINMPVMDGFEFLEAFKKKRAQLIALQKIVPIVMLTSSADSTDKDKAFSTGIVSEYIVKPFDIVEMDTVIRQIIS